MTAGARPQPDRIEFFFDYMCPWAYRTSVWIREVREQVGFAIDWRFFSLEEVNREEGKKHPWERDFAYGWTPMRVAAWLRRRDMDWCDRWYLACGRALHDEGRRPYDREVALRLLEENDPTICAPITTTPPRPSPGSACRSSWCPTDDPSSDRL